MDIVFKKGDLLKENADLLILGLFEKKKSIVFKEILVEEDFKAKPDETLLIHTHGKIPAKKVLFVGLGNKSDFDEEKARSAIANAYNVAKKIKAEKIVSELIGDSSALVEGLRFAEYNFGKYKSKNAENKIKSIEFISQDGKAINKANNNLKNAETVCKGVIFARDLVNTPAGHMKPEELANEAKKIARNSSKIQIKVFDQDDLKEMNAGGILGIAQGSDHEPFLVHLIYKPKKKAKKRIALVGKAITFDSGGYSLKPWQGMVDMKCDMAGAAAVLGLFSTLDQLDLPVEVHGIFGACENMVSGKAIRPGDIITTMNKKTIEIVNTDAEGRVTLADALSYAVKQEPDCIIDIATLTGACLIALGTEYSALLSNNEKLADKILDASHKADEKIWELPLEKNYKKNIQSDIADYKNDTPREGGTITAAHFLEEFVEKIPWVHLDIAGPSFCSKPLNAYSPKGATGHPVRTLVEFLRSI